MKIPETVRVGPTDFEVRLIDYLGGKGGPLATICYDQARIEIEESTAEPTRVVALWHEIVHALVTVAGQEDQKPEECITRALSFGIVQVLRDNPHLIEYTTGREVAMTEEEYRQWREEE